MVSFFAFAKVLGYADEIRQLLALLEFDIMEKLNAINKHKKRKCGRNGFMKKVLTL